MHNVIYKIINVIQSISLIVLICCMSLDFDTSTNVNYIIYISVFLASLLILLLTDKILRGLDYAKNNR